MLGNLRQAVTAQLMRVELVRQAAEAPPPEAPDMFGTHIDGTTGENDFEGGETRPSGPPGCDRHRCARGPRPEQPGDLGQGRPQRSLPLRLRQEIQALPRRVRVSTRSSFSPFTGRRKSGKVPEGRMRGGADFLLIVASAHPTGRCPAGGKGSVGPTSKLPSASPVPEKAARKASPSSGGRSRASSGNSFSSQCFRLAGQWRTVEQAEAAG